MHISKNETSNILSDNFYLTTEERRYHVNTFSPADTKIYTKTQISQKRNIPIPQSINKRNYSNQIKQTNNSSMLSQEKVKAKEKNKFEEPKMNITSIEIHNPNPIIKQNISFRNSETIDPLVNTNSNQFSSRALHTLLFNYSKPEGYLNIISSKSFNIPDLKPDEFIKQKNKMKEDREKIRSLSNLILHNKSLGAKAYSKKIVLDQMAKQNRSLTASPNKIFVKQTLNLLLNKKESQNIIITRAMRLERGGVVDLGSIQRGGREFNISNYNNTKLNTYSRKDKMRAAICIQLWWRKILAQYKNTIAKITLIQSKYKNHYKKKMILANVKIQKEVEPFISKLHVIYKYLLDGFLMIKHNRHIKIKCKENNALINLDLMLIINLLIIKQRTLDKIKERATVNKIYMFFIRMTKVLYLTKHRIIIMNGGTLFRQLRCEKRVFTLNKLISNLAVSRLKKSLNQYKTATCFIITNKQNKRLLTTITSLFTILIYKVIDKKIKQQNKTVLIKLNDWEFNSQPKIMLKSKPKLLKAIQTKTSKEYFNLFAKWLIWKRKTKTIKVLKSIRVIQSQTKNYLLTHHIKAIKMILYQRLLRLCLDKMIQEAKRRTLIKSLFIIRNRKSNNLYYGYHKIKKYTEIKYLVQNTFAKIIQNKFLNAFPIIKAKRLEAMRNKHHRYTSRILLNACRLIQRKYKRHYLIRKANVYCFIKELFIDWTIKMSHKPSRISIDITAQRRYFNGAKYLFRFYITNRKILFDK